MRIIWVYHICKSYMIIICVYHIHAHQFVICVPLWLSYAWHIYDIFLARIWLSYAWLIYEFKILIYQHDFQGFWPVKITYMILIWLFSWDIIYLHVYEDFVHVYEDPVMHVYEVLHVYDNHIWVFSYMILIYECVYTCDVSCIM